MPEGSGLITERPFRMPHHSASHEGLVGGGKHSRPGEVTLAHKGILFLDEAPEFRQNLLQGLREPIENRTVTICPRGKKYFIPASFQLVMTANPCPCGNLGRNKRVCYCSTREIQAYWKRLGGMEKRMFSGVMGEYCKHRNNKISRRARQDRKEVFI